MSVRLSVRQTDLFYCAVLAMFTEALYLIFQAVLLCAHQDVSLHAVSTFSVALSDGDSEAFLLFRHL